MLKLIILGSGTAVPFEKRASSGYLVYLNNNKKLLLDAGFWVLQRLESINISPIDLDYIFISHKHPDHFTGLIHILFALKHPIYQSKKKLTIFGFQGLEEYIKSFENILGHWIKPNIDIKIIENKNYLFEEFEYNLFSTFHTNESVGVKLNIDGKKIVYTGDTGFFNELIMEVNESDLLIIDCASNDKNRIEGHLSFSEILKILKKAKVSKTVLTHFYPDSIPTINEKNNILLAEDLLEILI